jgi:asparagine synthase (glutamine-hydrolysing)
VFIFVQDDCTRFQQFPPGHYYNSKTQEFTPYYKPEFYLGFDASPQRFPTTPLDLAKLRTSFEKSVIKRLMSDVPFGEVKGWKWVWEGLRLS